MFCPHCGAQIADDAKVCEACGAELSQQQQPAAPTEPQTEFAPKTSPMAIWSLILGILGWFICVTVIPGVILGILGLKQVKEKPREFTGSGLAIAGIVVSAVGVFVFAVVMMLAAILFPVFFRARSTAQTAICQRNVGQLCRAVMMYSSDFDGKYPPAAGWCDAVKPYATSITKNADVYRCPAVPDKECGYGFNGALGGISEADIDNAAETVLIFESDYGWNANGGRDAMITKSRHNGRFNTGYADTHVAGVYDSELSQLVWSPKP